MAKKEIVVPEPDPARLQSATALAERAPLPAGRDNILFGTAGWTDPTLLQSRSFYPKVSQSAEERLRFYAQHFSLVEVDATYYTLLPPETAARWVEWTPSEFVFDIKAHPIVTGHPIDVSRMPGDLRDALNRAGHERRVYPDKLPQELHTEIERRFYALLEPLAQSEKLGCVLAQFPPWFTATRGNARKVASLSQRHPDVTFAVEFRHKSWLAPERRDRVNALLMEGGLAYVCVDEPDTHTGGVPPVIWATHPDLSFVRFHGHNRGGWEKKGASVHERFDYLYTPQELQSWVKPVRKLSRESKRVHAVFNNCVRNYAVLGAKGLSVLLTGSEAPETDGALPGVDSTPS